MFHKEENLVDYVRSPVTVEENSNDGQNERTASSVEDASNCVSVVDD